MSVRRPASVTSATRLTLVALLIAFTSAACDARDGASPKVAATREDAAYSGAEPQSPPPPPPPPAPAPAEAAMRVGGGAANSAQSRPSADPATAGSIARKIIRNGSVRLEVKDTDRAVDAVKTMLAGFGGYLAAEQRDQDATTGRQAFLTCRVPAERLDEMLAKLREIGTQESVNLSSDDITEQYLDLDVRLRTQQQLEERLRALLERPTNRLSDLLEIEREVARVRSEIDSMQGRKRYWDNQVAFSTLSVHLHEPRPIVAGEQGGVWATLKASFGEAADNFVQTIAGIIAATGALVPLAVALVAAFLAIRFAWRRARRR